MKKIALILFVIILFLVGYFVFNKNTKLAPQIKSDYKNTTYIIEDKPVVFTNGYYEELISPISSSKIISKYFGDEIFGDINNDGNMDVAFIITQSGGGSGTFYYAVAALKTTDGYVGTNGILLGDRIAPQNIQIENGKIIVNYADRKSTDAMIIPPSIGVSKYLKIQNGSLVDISEIESHKDLIKISNPVSGMSVYSPIEISGEARGSWYFEGSFPVVLTDWDGKIIAQGVATAQNEWMTSNFVPFKATLTYNLKDISGEYSNKGTLIFKKDNPSGLSKYDDALEVSVILK